MKYHVDRSLGYLSQVVSKAMGKRLQHHFEENDMEVTIDQWLALIYLENNSQVNHFQLGEFCNKDKAGITRVVDALEQQEYVRRVPSKKDRRNKFIEISDKGITFTQKLKDMGQVTNVEATQGISEADLETCKKVLRQVMENLKTCDNQEDEFLDRVH